MTTTIATCRYCGAVCVDDDTDTARQVLADHQWRAHPEAVCGCGHVRAEHAVARERLIGACRRCGCVAFGALSTPTPRPALDCAALQRRLDEIGGLLSCACVSHVWSVVLTIDGVPRARAQDADLVDALRRVVTIVEETADAAV